MQIEYKLNATGVAQNPKACKPWLAYCPAYPVERGRLWRDNRPLAGLAEWWLIGYRLRCIPEAWWDEGSFREALDRAIGANGRRLGDDSAVVGIWEW